MTRDGYEAPQLTPEAEQRLQEIGQADILVGIPSFNNARTIGHVASAAMAGMVKHFPGARCVLVNSDGGSTDGTREAVLSTTQPEARSLLVQHEVTTAQKLVTPYHGLPGKGSAFRTIFYIADRLGAKACAVVDSDLRNITPDWFEVLLEPVVHEGIDFVAPMYVRHKFDGTITNSIVYPVTRALYGVKIRQPIGGDFGFSGRLARHWLTKDVWQSEVARFGIDIWMTTTAVADGFKAAQGFLGAKIHDPKDPGADLAGMLMQVVGTVFRLMKDYEPAWRSEPPEQDVPLYGFSYSAGLEPIHVNRKRMVDLLHQGLRDLTELYASLLSQSTMASVKELERQDENSIDFDDTVWCHVVYDFAAAHHRGAINRELLLKALTPLYLGRVATFVRRHQDSDGAKVEEAIDSLCRTFRAERPYLYSRWEGREAAAPEVTT